MTVEKDSGRRQARLPQDIPCIKEKSLSLKCLDQNNYDYSKCNAVFDNFKFCMEFWDKVKKMRRANQIMPELPPPEERAEIQRKYKTTGKYPNYSSGGT